MIKKLLKKVPFFGKLLLLIKIKLEFYKDLKFFLKNYSKSKETQSKIEYNILLITHSIEKGMSNLNPRPFGELKVKELINYVERLNKYENHDTYAYFVAINCLRSYNNFYLENNWEFKDINKKVKSFLENYKYVPNINVGTHLLTEKDYITNVDYLKFMQSRHSVRNFSHKKLLKSDIKKAVEMTLLSPTACNRQMCKIYYVNSTKGKELVRKNAQGIGGFELNNINYFIVTFDISANYFVGERNQGWFNSGLVAMNFVNALHSLGIGSCFIQFGNTFKEEEKLKKQLNISSNERIAVILTAGYYAKESKIPYSPRKSIEDIYSEI